MKRSDQEKSKGGLLPKLIGLDIVLAAVIVSGTILFVSNAGRLLGHTISQLFTPHAGDNNPLMIAVSLNMAMLMIGWRRYRDLNHEVRERTRAEERANLLAMRDPLTGLHNRRSLCDSTTVLIDRATASRKSVAVLLIDLDHFKRVNDIHGHMVGDALLRTAASIIVEKLPIGSVIARLGGDEFACAMVYDRGLESTVTDIVDAIIAGFDEPVHAGEIVVRVGASIGIAATDGDRSVETLIRCADIAMYAAKQAGRNRLCWFDDSMELQLRERNAIEIDMRDGLQRGEFEPYFEQQIDLANGQLTGFEVLARWNHPTRGMVMPDNFIHIAEETGMIEGISESVSRQAMLAAKDWDQALTLAINISPVQLRDPWLAQKIVKLLVETGFPASRLEIEITESALFENIAVAQSIVLSLKNQGIRIALDDFGTGYSSLAHLRALPFDRLKIDKSFVTSILENSESAAIVNAITGLGASLNLSVTAEGVERQEIVERLAPMGIGKAQGWHYGLPMSRADVDILVNGVPAAPALEQPAAKKSIRKAA